MRPTADVPEARPGLRSFNRRWVVTLAWIVLWLPLSLLFPPLNAHLPVPPFLMPIFFVFIPILGGRLDHAEIWLPVAVFWGGLLLALSLRRLIPRRGESQ